MSQPISKPSLVQEVINFVNEGNLFKESKSSVFQDNSFFIERDFHKAKKYAFEQNVDYANLCWIDIKENEQAELYAKIFILPNYKDFSHHLHELTDPFFKTLKTQLPRSYNDILEEIATDMRSILENRATNGLTDNFFETLFLVYKNGGWPCGWKGDYPEGKMIVFMPQS